MFYTNESFFEEIDEYLNDIKIMEEKLIIESKYRGRVESDLRISLIIKTTGTFENLFYDIIKDFSCHHSSPIFHKYFKARFKDGGKNVSPNTVNSILSNLDIKQIKKDENPISFSALESLYNIRNDISHGTINFQESIEDIRGYITHSKDFFRQIIARLEEYT